MSKVRKIYLSGEKKFNPNLLAGTCLEDVNNPEQADATVELGVGTARTALEKKIMSRASVLSKDGSLLWVWDEGEPHEKNGVWNQWYMQLNLAVGCGKPKVYWNHKDLNRRKKERKEHREQEAAS